MPLRISRPSPAPPVNNAVSRSTSARRSSRGHSHQSPQSTPPAPTHTDKPPPPAPDSSKDAAPPHAPPSESSSTSCSGSTPHCSAPSSPTQTAMPPAHPRASCLANQSPSLRQRLQRMLQIPLPHRRSPHHQRAIRHRLRNAPKRNCRQPAPPKHPPPIAPPQTAPHTHSPPAAARNPKSCIARATAPILFGLRARTSTTTTRSLCSNRTHSRHSRRTTSTPQRTRTPAQNAAGLLTFTATSALAALFRLHSLHFFAMSCAHEDGPAYWHCACPR